MPNLRTMQCHFQQQDTSPTEQIWIGNSFWTDIKYYYWWLNAIIKCPSGLMYIIFHTCNWINISARMRWYVYVKLDWDTFLVCQFCAHSIRFGVSVLSTYFFLLNVQKWAAAAARSMDATARSDIYVHIDFTAMFLLTFLIAIQHIEAETNDLFSADEWKMERHRWTNRNSMVHGKN